jgi:hypothetical protein
MGWAAGLVTLSALIAWFGIRDGGLVETPPPLHCALNGPPPNLARR